MKLGLNLTRHDWAMLATFGILGVACYAVLGLWIAVLVTRW